MDQKSKRHAFRESVVMLHKKILVVSEHGTWMGQLAKIAGQKVGVDVQVEELLGLVLNSLFTIMQEWRGNPSKWDAMLLGHPHTSQARIYARGLTMHALAAEETCNFLIRQRGDFELLGHDSRAQGIESTLRLKGVRHGQFKTALVVGDQSPAAVAAWACNSVGIQSIGVLNGAGRAPEKVPGVYGVVTSGKPFRDTQKALSDLVENPVDLLINAMRPGGAGSDGAYTQVPVPLELLTPRTTVLDVVYNPVETPLITAARKRECPVITGRTPVALRVLYGMELVLDDRPDEQDYLEEVRRQFSY